VVILVYFSRFGMLCRVKTGNLALPRFLTANGFFFKASSAIYLGVDLSISFGHKPEQILFYTYLGWLPGHMSKLEGKVLP
jgi:hypothetical protein